MTSSWETVRLGDVAILNPENTSGWGADRKIRYIDISSVSAESGIASDALVELAYGKAPGRARRVVRRSDVLVSTVRPNLRAFAQVPPALDGQIASTGFTVIRAVPERVLPDYVWALVRTERFVSSMVEQATGSNYPAIRPQNIADYMISIPSLDEQRRVVDLIGSLDDAIESADSEALSADRLWWEITKDLEKASSNLEMKPLGEISDISGGLTKNKKDSEQPDLVEVPYLRVANVHRRYLDLTDVALIKTTQSKIDKLRLLPGDIVMNEGGDKDKLGRGAIWRGEIDNCIHQNHVFRVRVTSPEFSPEFVSNWSNSFGQRWFETFGTQTTGIASISKTTLSRFPVPLMPPVEQQEWVALLESTLSVHDEAKAQATFLRKLRSELLTSLLSGAHTIPESYDEVMTVAEELVTT